MGKVIYASHSGWFPFCIKKEEPPIYPLEENATFYPLKLSLEDAMFLFWRVKTWNLYCENNSTNFKKTVSISMPINKEEELVCLNDPLYFIDTDENFDPGTGEDSFGFILFFSFDQIYSPEKVFEYNDFFYPGITVTFGLGESAAKKDKISFDAKLKKIKWANDAGDGILELYPQEYWPYGETWDTKTGARL